MAPFPMMGRSASDVGAILHWTLSQRDPPLIKGCLLIAACSRMSLSWRAIIRLGCPVLLPQRRLLLIRRRLEDICIGSGRIVRCDKGVAAGRLRVCAVRRGCMVEALVLRPCARHMISVSE